MLLLWLLHQLQPSQLSPGLGGRKAPGGPQGRGWGWLEMARARVVREGRSWCPRARRCRIPACGPRELPGVTLPTLASQPPSTDIRNVPLRPITSSHRGNDLIGRTAAENETPGDGFRNIAVIFMQMSSVVKKEGGGGGKHREN